MQVGKIVEGLGVGWEGGIRVWCRVGQVILGCCVCWKDGVRVW